MLMQLRLIIIISFLSTSFAYAQSAKRGGGDKKTTAINFEDELVEGEVKKPELLYLLQKKQFNFKRLIKLRENFLPEMGRTAEDINRGRGNN
jgi:hypothetical protein